jgi:hypothetical protein
MQKAPIRNGDFFALNSPFITCIYVDNRQLPALALLGLPADRTADPRLPIPPESVQCLPNAAI